MRSRPLARSMDRLRANLRTGRPRTVPRVHPPAGAGSGVRQGIEQAEETAAPPKRLLSPPPTRDLQLGVPALHPASQTPRRFLRHPTRSRFQGSRRRLSPGSRRGLASQDPIEPVDVVPPPEQPPLPSLEYPPAPRGPRPASRLGRTSPLRPDPARTGSAPPAALRFDTRRRRMPAPRPPRLAATRTPTPPARRRRPRRAGRSAPAAPAATASTLAAPSAGPRSTAAPGAASDGPPSRRISPRPPRLPCRRSRRRPPSLRPRSQGSRGSALPEVPFPTPRRPARRRPPKRRRLQSLHAARPRPQPRDSPLAFPSVCHRGTRSQAR